MDLVDAVGAQVDRGETEETLEAADGVEAVMGKVKREDLTEVGVDAEDGVDHVVGEVEGGEVVEL